LKIIKINKYANDQTLISDCIDQKSAAQKYLFNKYSRLFLAISNRYISNEKEAEDVMMESFMIIFNKIKTFNNKGSLEGWMKKILVNNCIGHLRKNKIMFVSLEKVNQNENIYSTDENSENKAEVLMKILKSLPEGYRSVFNLYVMEEYKHKEIAEILNISENTSKSQLFKAKKMIKRQLKQLDEKNLQIDKEEELIKSINISHG